MKRIPICCAVVLLSGASFAADLTVTPAQRPILVQRVYEWTGLYFGVNAGWGWGHNDSRIGFLGVFDGNTTPGGLGATELSRTTVTGSTDVSGAIAGGQIGFNWQWGALVLGGEFDVQWSGQEGSTAAVCSTAACTATEAPQLRAFATMRGRLGWAFDNVMPYVTGGMAFVNMRNDLTMTVAGVNASFLPLSATSLGWAAGAGVEAALWSNWSAKLEYLYIGWVATTATIGIPGVLGAGTAAEDTSYHDNIVRVGVNYRFGPNRGSALLEPLPAYAAAVPVPEIATTRYAGPPAAAAARQVASAPPKPAASAPPAAAQGDAVAQGDADETVAAAVATAPPAPSARAIELPKLAGFGADTERPRRARTRAEAADASRDKDESRRIRRLMDICQGC
jgi:outer membrane immunogenic protein